MAIDFPASPTPGQVYQGYYWDDDKNAWRSQSTNRGSVITSATTPTGATAGDLWFNTVDGTMYVYYNDGITTQWVEIQANVDNYKTPTFNYLINGAFDIWQRGTSFTSTTYGADRWFHPISNATVSQETLDLPAGFRYGIKYVTTGTGFSQFNQAIERDTVIGLRGKTVTVSGWIKISGSYVGNWISQALYSNSTDAYASTTTLVPGSNKNVATAATTTWTRFTNTFVVPSDAIGLRIENIPDAQSGAGVTVRMTGLQLEEGTVATPFRRNQPNIQAELAACQRYYRRSYIYAAGATGGSNGDAWIVAVQFSVPMRIAPIVAWISGGTAMDGTADKPITGLYGTPYRNGTVDGVEILYKGATAFAGSARPVTVREALTEFNAEL